MLKNLFFLTLFIIFGVCAIALAQHSPVVPLPIPSPNTQVKIPDTISFGDLWQLVFVPIIGVVVWFLKNDRKNLLEKIDVAQGTANTTSTDQTTTKFDLHNELMSIKEDIISNFEDKMKNQNDRLEQQYKQSVYDKDEIKGIIRDVEKTVQDTASDVKILASEKRSLGTTVLKLEEDMRIIMSSSTKHSVFIEELQRNLNDIGIMVKNIKSDMDRNMGRDV